MLDFLSFLQMDKDLSSHVFPVLRLDKFNYSEERNFSDIPRFVFEKDLTTTVYFVDLDLDFSLRSQTEDACLSSINAYHFFIIKYLRVIRFQFDPPTE